MRLSRRTLLGAAAGGGAMAVLGTASATSALPLSQGPTLVLVANAVDGAFTAGLGETLGSEGAVLTVTGPETLAKAARWLAARPGRKVVGLVDSADGILFQQMVPRGGARWLSSNHHSLSGEGDAAQVRTLGQTLGLVAAGRVVGGEVAGRSGGLPFMSFVVAG